MGDTAFVGDLVELYEYLNTFPADISKLDLTISKLGCPVFGIGLLPWEDLIEVFKDVNNINVEKITSISLKFYRVTIDGSISIIKLIDAIKHTFPKVTNLEIERLFPAFLPNVIDNHSIPQVKPKMFGDLCQQLRKINSNVKVTVKWAVFEYYVPGEYERAVKAYKKLLKDFRLLTKPAHQEKFALPPKYSFTKTEKMSKMKKLQINFFVLFKPKYDFYDV